MARHECARTARAETTMKENESRLNSITREVETQLKSWRVRINTTDATWLLSLARGAAEMLDTIQQEKALLQTALNVTQDDWAAADRRAREQFERQQAEILSLQSQLTAARAEIAAGETLRESMYANTQRLLKLLAEKKR